MQENVSYNSEQIQSYIMSEEEMNAPEERKTLKPKPQMTYLQVVGNGTDGVFKKIDSRKAETVAAFIASQNQYYIKDKNGNIEAMTAENLKKFLYALPEGSLEVKNVTWLKSLEKGKVFAENLMGFIGRFGPLLKNGFCSYEYYMHNKYSMEALLGIANSNEKLLKYLFQKACEVYETDNAGVFSLMDNNVSRYHQSKTFMKGTSPQELVWLRLIVAQYGLDNAKKFIDGFALSNMSIAMNEYSYMNLMAQIDSQIQQILEDTGMHRYTRNDETTINQVCTYLESANFKHNKDKFEFDRFLKYCLERKNMGFFSLDDMISTWGDTLSMQKKIRKKIVDKYPEHLQEVHNIYCMNCEDLKEILEKQDFEEQYELNKVLEWENGGWLFILPKSPQDVMDERENMHNCLASYIGNIANGQKRIIFMRKTSDPEKSLVDIEVYNDGSIGQVKGPCNRAATQAERNAVAAWATEKGLTFHG